MIAKMVGLPMSLPGLHGFASPVTPNWRGNTRICLESNLNSSSAAVQFQRRPHPANKKAVAAEGNVNDKILLWLACAKSVMEVAMRV
jgi:hypothetical protein